jgi:hypothetical protein
MEPYLISDRAVVYDAVTQASSNLVIIPNMTNFIDPQPQVSGNSYVGINGTVFANYFEGGIMVNSLHYEEDATGWNAFYNSQTFDPSTPFENNFICTLKYLQANMPEMFGLQPSEWSLLTL